MNETIFEIILKMGKSLSSIEVYTFFINVLEHTSAVKDLEVSDYIRDMSRSSMAVFMDESTKEMALLLEQLENELYAHRNESSCSA